MKTLDLNKLQKINDDLYFNGKSGEYFDSKGNFLYEAENFEDYEDINEPTSELD